MISPPFVVTINISSPFIVTIITTRPDVAVLACPLLPETLPVVPPVVVLLYLYMLLLLYVKFKFWIRRDILQPVHLLYVKFLNHNFGNAGGTFTSWVCTTNTSNQQRTWRQEDRGDFRHQWSDCVSALPPPGTSIDWLFSFFLLVWFIIHVNLTVLDSLGLVLVFSSDDNERQELVESFDFRHQCDRASVLPPGTSFDWLFLFFLHVCFILYLTVLASPLVLGWWHSSGAAGIFFRQQLLEPFASIIFLVRSIFSCHCAAGFVSISILHSFLSA